MNTKNLQRVTGLVAIAGVLYAAGVFTTIAAYFSTTAAPSGCTDSGYGYQAWYGYGYLVNCPVVSGGWGGGGSSNTTTKPTTSSTGTVATGTITTGVVTTTGTTTPTTTDTDTSTSPVPTSSSDPEVVDAYEFGFANGLTTLSIEKARLYEGLTRYELAKMISAFIKNVAGKEAVENPVCDITTFGDYASFDDEMKTYIKMACDYGVMGWKNDKSGLIANFNPFDVVTREQFAAVLSRYLFGDANNDANDLMKHLKALKAEGIMNLIDKPLTTEVRGYVLIMFQRVANK